MCRRVDREKIENEQDLSQVEVPSEDGVMSGWRLLGRQHSLILPWRGYTYPTESPSELVTHRRDGRTMPMVSNHVFTTETQRRIRQKATADFAEEPGSELDAGDKGGTRRNDADASVWLTA